MGYRQRLHMTRGTEARVLKAQLNVIADMMQGLRVVLPLWALLATLSASLMSAFKAVPLERSALLPLAVGLAMLLSDRLVLRYRADIAAGADHEKLQVWFARFLMVQITISVCWGLLPWLFWQPGNEINHLILAVVVVALLADAVISRISVQEMFLGSTVPLLVMSALRFALSGTAVDLTIAGLCVIVTMQLFDHCQKLTARLDADAKLRFDVEDMARELEEARDEALRKRFEAETANASKTAFLANMSHELRTPLNAILGFSEIIAKECFGAVGSPRYVEYAGDIHASGAHLLSLINDLLDVAKIEAGRMEIQPEPLDPNKTFESALKLVGAKAREQGQKLVIETAPDLPELYADERAVKQILINLVSNAVKFTPQGGRIAVLACRARDGGFQILVEDDGPGIPREKLDRIFKPFSQVDNRYDRQGGGTGLGLALVRGLSELHGGRAWLESEPGKGCRAYVVFPPPGGPGLIADDGAAPGVTGANAAA